MTSNPEKAALRKHLLEKRDSTSYDLMEIHSKRILSKLIKTKIISEAESIGCYYSIGSEVQTLSIIHDLINSRKNISLPKVNDDTMKFRIIKDFEKLEKGSFGILEPKDDWIEEKSFDIFLIPAISFVIVCPFKIFSFPIFI